MWSRYKNLLFAIIVVLAGAIFIWQVIDKGGSDNAQSQTAANTTNAPAKEVKYDGVAGKNALVLLKTSHKTETKTYKGLGELVTSIDGVKADTKHFWSFYVNDKPASVGAGSYTTKSGDKIAWKLEEIK